MSPSFPPSLLWCHSPGAHNLLCLSCCAFRLHAVAAPPSKQPDSGIPVMSCTPHVPIIPSFLPSTLRHNSCHGRICLGLSRQQYTTKQTKNRLVSCTEFLDNKRHNLPNLLQSSSLHDLTTRSRSIVWLPYLAAPPTPRPC